MLLWFFINKTKNLRQFSETKISIKGLQIILFDGIVSLMNTATVERQPIPSFGFTLVKADWS